VSLAKRDPNEPLEAPGSLESVLQLFGVQLSRSLQQRQQQVQRAFGRAAEWFRFVDVGGPKS
jgi:hypothetical protein